MAMKRETYTDSFKIEAIKKVDENDGNVSGTAKQLNLPMQTLAHWYRLAKAGKIEGTEHYNPDVVAMHEEIRTLKKALKTAEEERDILKKATAYFAKHSR